MTGALGRRRMMAVLALVALISTGCIQGVRQGQRCRSNDFGDDGTHVLACKAGRWQRVMTRAQAVQLIVKVIEAKRFPPEAAPSNTSASKLAVVYVVAADQAVDPNVAPHVRSQLEGANLWFANQAGRQLDLLRNPAGAIEVVQLRLKVNAAQIDNTADPRAALRAALVDVGMTFNPVAPIVVTPLRGGACAHGSDFVVIWLAKGSGECSASPTIAARAAQQIVHLMGAVPSCAPHFRSNGGVGDFSNDLMYEGPGKVFETMVLDGNHDDYYGHGRPDCYDIARSPFWL